MFANASGFLVQQSTFNEVHGDLNQGARGLSGMFLHITCLLPHNVLRASNP